MVKWFVRFLWTLLILVVLGTAFAFYAIDEGWIGYMPPIEDLQNPINRYATQVYSADGKLIGTWNYNRENRVLVDYTKLSPALVDALVCTEDARFYEHSGIDFYALARAIVKRGVLGQKSAARQAALHRARALHTRACAPEAHRVGHRRQARAQLHQG
jgi:penicillin-binding protein 1A